MKKILFVIPSMHIGGTRSSLINLLSCIAKDESLNISLFIICHEGELIASIPERVNILPEIKLLSWAVPSKCDRNVLRKIYHAIIAVLNRIFGYQKVYQFLLWLSGNRMFSTQQYDSAVGYQEGVATFVSSKVMSKKHFLWIHSDVDKWFDDINFESCAYESAQKIIFVAENTKTLFINKFQQWSNKCIVIKNLLNTEDILNKSYQHIDDIEEDRNAFKILSIGRLSEAKAFDRVILTAKYLMNHGINFTWDIIGQGELYDNLFEMIHTEQVESHVRLLGARPNPYPYIKSADLIVVSSINESQPMVILEALTLSKPVLTTGYPSATEILMNGKYGLICDNSLVGLYTAVEKIIKDDNTYKTLCASTKKFVYDNDFIVNQISELFKSESLIE